MTTKQDEFIQSLEGGLTPQQAAQLLEMGDEGDTGAASETGGAPGASAVDGESGAAQGGASKNEAEGASTAADGEGTQTSTTVDESTLNSDNAVIVAKDGKHHIGYDKLLEARDGEKQAKAALAAAEEKLQALQAAAESRADSGQVATKTDNQVAAAQAAIDQGVNPEIFGDFSEEALAKGISTLVSMKVDERVAAALAKVDERLAPLQKEHQTAKANSHFDPIYTKHPDADSIVESKELADWISSQPSFAQSGIRAVLNKGSAQQVIELFDTFKQATGVTQAEGKTAQTDDEVKAAAKQAIAGAKPPVPASLSDIPGGRPGAGATRHEVMGQMSATDLADAMEGMSPEQIDEFLNRQM